MEIKAPVGLYRLNPLPFLSLALSLSHIPSDTLCNKVRNFPTHGQLSAAQGNPTQGNHCLSFSPD